MKLVQIKDEMVKQLYAYRKINKKDSSELDELVTELLNNIDYINSLPRDARWVGDAQMEDIAIPTALKDLFYPNSVTLQGKHTDVDFLQREKFDNAEFIPWTLREWSLKLATLYGYFKRDASSIQYVSLLDIRKDVVFTEINYSHEGKVKGEIPDTNGYIPISTKFSDILLSDERQMFEDHLIDNIAREIATKSN